MHEFLEKEKKKLHEHTVRLLLEAEKEVSAAYEEYLRSHCAVSFHEKDPELEKKYDRLLAKKISNLASIWDDKNLEFLNGKTQEDVATSLSNNLFKSLSAKRSVSIPEDIQHVCDALSKVLGGYKEKTIPQKMHQSIGEKRAYEKKKYGALMNSVPLMLPLASLDLSVRRAHALKEALALSESALKNSKTSPKVELDPHILFSSERERVARECFLVAVNRFRPVRCKNSKNSDPSWVSPVREAYGMYELGLAILEGRAKKIQTVYEKHKLMLFAPGTIRYFMGSRKIWTPPYELSEKESEAYSQKKLLKKLLNESLGVLPPVLKRVKKL